MTELPKDGSAGLLVLGGRDIAGITDVAELIGVAREALRKTSDLTAVQDVRRVLDLEEPGGACLSVMYAAIADLPLFGAKVLSVLPQNFARGLPSHRGGILLFERDCGTPVAIVDGGQTTAWRTAAASAVATQCLSRENSSVLTLMGYGEQAERHVVALSAIRPIREIRVWGRDPEKAEAFADKQRAAGFDAKGCDDAQTAVAGADIVCTVTSARTPILSGEWLTPGTHVNAVGASVPSIRELDDACVTRSGIWVDYMPMALTSAGEIVEAIRDGLISKDHLKGEIGAVINGAIPGRTSDDQITLYRSLGVPAQDIEFANFFYAVARSKGLGATVPFEDLNHA
ncbi:MAG: ornithine cyclodeaminase [Rhizobiales bacterium]|nr:ornithine cyclodeaminase [Hyphomicrobiales bacterium]MBA68419.1 ornithine cyclodeaminase [Hyphomicrobiales bacterium]